MYKIFFSVLLGLCGLLAFAAPWGALDDSSYSRNKPKSSLTKLADKTLLPLLLARQTPVRYCVEGTPEADQYAQFLEQGYTEWFTATARFIRGAKRTDEFADLLPFLEQPLLFRRQSCARNKNIEDTFLYALDGELLEKNPSSVSEQVRFLLVPEADVSRLCRGRNVAEVVACAGSAQEFGAHVVIMPYRSEQDTSWWSSLLHELGHTMGVGEGYKLGATKNNPYFGTNFRQGGVMNAQDGVPAVFSCDEADALIALSDALSVPGKPARTGKTARTFQSLCAHDPVWYTDGRLVQRSDYAAGDEQRFTQASFQADGRPGELVSFTPDTGSFSQAMRLFEQSPFAGNGTATGGMTYYPQKNGRTFAVQNLESDGLKRVFTLKNKNLLGTTVLYGSDPDRFQAVTVLKDPRKKTQKLRDEAILRLDSENYGPYFVWAKYEGEVRAGGVRGAAAQVVYLFKNWMIVSLIAPGSARNTVLLLESAERGEGQRIHVYQQNFMDEKLFGGDFSLVSGRIQPAGELSARDEAYVKNFVSFDKAQDNLQAAGGVSIFQFGQDMSGRPVGVKEVSDWVWTASRLHAEMGTAVKTYLADRPLDFSRSGLNKQAYREFLAHFRPSPPVQVALTARKK